MNVTEVVFSGFYKTQICGLYQYDYGQMLKFTDITLPSTYEVHFAQSGASTTVTVLGDSNGVQIPDQYLLADLDIRAYIYLHEEETDGETVYQVLIPVIARPEPTDVEPTPVEQDIITQTIAALNSAVDTAEGYAADANQSASDSAASAISAQAWAEAAQESAESIDMSNYATKAELQSEASTRSLADTRLGNDIDAETQRATQAEASIRLAIPSKTSQLQNDSGFLTSAPVSSVNGKTGAVNLSASDVGALPSSTAIPFKTSDLQNDSNYITASEAPVQSVNGMTGAVTISAEGLSEDAKQALIDCFRHVAWIDSNGTQYVNALISALYELQSITAVYTQSGTVYDTDSLDDLKTDLVVTANYKGGTSEKVTSYTLSGTLEAGTSIITVSYSGKTATFDVTVTETAGWYYPFDGDLESTSSKDFGFTGVENYVSGVHGQAYFHEVSTEGTSSTDVLGIKAVGLTDVPDFSGDFTLAMWHKSITNKRGHLFAATKYYSGNRPSGAIGTISNVASGWNVTYDAGTLKYRGVGIQWMSEKLNIRIHSNTNTSVGGQYQITPPSTFDSTEWHHYALTKKDTTIYFFVDGNIIFTLTNVNDAVYFADQVCIGNGFGETASTSATLTSTSYGDIVDDLYIAEICRWSETFDPETIII